MRAPSLGRKVLVSSLIAAIVATGCATPAQMQKKYSSFDSCFKEEKKSAMMMGAIGGGLVGALLGNNQRNKVVAGGALAAMGAIIGNRAAWQGCLQAFPVQSQTSVISDRATTLTQARPGVPSGPSAPRPAQKSLVIQNVQAGPLVFGRDLEITVTYGYISDNPSARDIKARVARNLLFKAPDGSLQEVASGTEDTIQQGTSRTTFAIPTPSVEDGKELLGTTNWAFKFVVEVDGMRQERIVALNVPQLRPNAAVNSPTMLTGSSGVTLNLVAGTLVRQDIRSHVVVAQPPNAQQAMALQRPGQGQSALFKVRVADGKEGWIQAGTAI